MDELLTAREVQDLLRIDRTTVYRMLKDGRLEGVKVANQWRFPRRALNDMVVSGAAAPETRTSDSNIHSLAAGDALPLHCVQSIQDVFADLAGVGALLAAPDGEPLTTISNGCRFCALIQSSPSGRAACRAEWAALASRTVQEPRPARCHAGLRYLHARIDNETGPLAMLVGGQFSHPDDSTDVGALAERHGLDPHELAAARREVPIHDVAGAARVGRSLRKVATTFADIARERAAMIGRLRSIAALSAFEVTAE